MATEIRGKGRPPVASPKNIRSVRIDDALWEKVQQVAAAEHRSASAQVSLMLEEAFAARAKKGSRR